MLFRSPLICYRKGCLARLCQDVASDGSRIEGSHKGWNSIMRSFSNGLEVYTALAHDFVLHRNLRVAASHGNKTGVARKFVALMDKLAEVEQQIIQWSTTGNFTCKQCSNETRCSPCSDLLKHAPEGQIFGKSTAVPSHSLKVKIQMYWAPRILGNQM